MEHLLEIVKKRSTPGILIFDMNKRLLYSNREALNILPDFGKIIKSKSENAKIIYNLCDDIKKRYTHKTVIEPNCAILNINYGPPCSLRAFPIGDTKKESRYTHIIVLIERIIEKRDLNFDKAIKRFNLTNREIDVLKLICEGLTNKEIANKLFICEYTVKDHIKRLMQKMGASSRIGIIAHLK